MMSRKTWSSISVYDFFRTYNWIGETTDLKAFDAVELLEISQSLLSSNLQDFLKKSNWKGHKDVNSFSPLIQPSNESLLNLSVNHFFRGIGCKKSPEIAPKSNNLSFTPPSNTNSSDLDVNNLSDLF
ncbi:MAG: hypothetical protein QNJ64_10305 [Crocosphaera sp.]|nr:hypothetical protein [Crocosphaera sp.]